MVATLSDHHKSELVTRSRLIADNRLAHDFVNAVLNAAFLLVGWLLTTGAWLALLQLLP